MEHIGTTLRQLYRERQKQPRIARLLRLPPVGSFLGEGDTLDSDEEAGEDVDGTEGVAGNEANPSSSLTSRVGESSPVRLPPEPWRPPLQTSRLAFSTGTKIEVCPICKGMEYTRADLPFGHPDFGKPIKCPCRLKKEKEREQQQLLEMSNLNRLEAFREASFATFDLFQPGVREAFLAALAFAKAPIGWLVLVGINGCGKTHLAVATARRRLDAGERVLFMTVPDLLDHLRATFMPMAQVAYDELFQKMREADLLVLDDLGSQHNTVWAKEKLFQLLNFRYNAVLPTVITANTLEVEPRISSRLADTSLVTLVQMHQASDYRRQAAGAMQTHDTSQEPDGRRGSGAEFAMGEGEILPTTQPLL